MINKKYNDYELIYMVRENDDNSRNILYEKYLPILKRLASEFYHKFKNYGFDYDDFLQEAYISFEKAIIRYDDVNGILFYSFAILCVRRGLVSFCRGLSSSRYISSDNMLDLDDVSISDEKADIGKITEESEVEGVFKSLILELPFDISCILELRLNNFTYSEISNLLNIPISTVEFRNRKVKRAVYDCLTKYYSKKTF